MGHSLSRQEALASLNRMGDDRKKRGRRDALGVFLIAILPILLIVGFFVYVLFVVRPLS